MVACRYESLMAPTRKKSVNKRFLNEVSPEKEARNSFRHKPRVLEKLGPRWSNEELQRFYNAYRHYGRDWKKVAAEVRNRSTEMVEALYNMNQAYLSLPEGLATVLGLIAMMTDHYTVLEASDSEQVSIDVAGMSQKLHKRKRLKLELSESKEDILQVPTDGCLTLLKRARLDGCQPRVVGKRTPRVPVSYPPKKDDGEKHVLSKKKNQKPDVDGNDDEVAHVAALTLTEASQKADSPQASETPRRSRHMDVLPTQGSDRMFQQIESAARKYHNASIYDDGSGDVKESKEDNIYADPRCTSSLLDMERVGTVEVHRKGKKFYGKKVKVKELGNSQSDDGEEACSGTGGGQTIGALMGKVGIEVSNAKTAETSGMDKKKRYNFSSGDEFSALDALQTLAHVSMMESESSVQLTEEKSVLDVGDKSTVPETTFTSDQLDNNKIIGQKGKVLTSGREVESAASRKSKLGRQSAIDSKPVSEVKLLLQSTNNNVSKRKRQNSVSKMLNGETAVDPHTSKQSQSGSLDVVKNICAVDCKHVGQVSGPSKQAKSVGGSDGSSLGAEHKISASDIPVSTAQVPVSGLANSQATRINRRKMGLKRALITKEGKSFEGIIRFSISKHDKAANLEKELSCCLSSSMFRRWCTFEWFCSAIDYPWFTKREFVEYLKHVQLEHIPRLTRVEWGVIRSSLGKPRRFSECFLWEERKKLQQYRESVRKHYDHLRTGIRDGLPADLARPLLVGQRVIALHPRTRELHDGSVLTVDRDRCRVQFDRPEIGVQMVKDIDCMPLNPLDNMPESLRRESLYAVSKEPEMSRHSDRGGVVTSGNFENASTSNNTLTKQAQVGANHAIPQAKAITIDAVNTQAVACNQPSMKRQGNEAETEPLSELSYARNKKAFPVFNSRQPNILPANTLPPWLNLPGNFSHPVCLPVSSKSSFSKELVSTASEIIKSSRYKAHRMVDAAVQAISLKKEHVDVYMRIEEAIDVLDKKQFASESKAQATSVAEQIECSLHHHQLSSASESQFNGDASMSLSDDEYDKAEASIPSKLIGSCVATLLMIQACSERQYNPGDIAKIIDSAVANLQPRCPQNWPIFREIEMCMGRIKTQILALIPT
ncbi:hypothetical protein K2173_022222 [Erythroxylum novogranatense]|uniref:SANT domain-containing protein n=1 Tax=Erythroxylum novogranatense TaxID=1862640 RepID=A0AAV8STN3_9ROSI|nr:hypothetical protein K2173_022222 [Erythroxylum novogranatense]